MKSKTQESISEMTPQVLRNEKEYTVPGKHIIWKVGSRTLDLEVELDWNKYERGGLVLPPVEMGRCKDWHFELSDDELTGKFIASWTIRRVKDKINLIEFINDNIKPFALNS
jgi:hypothetical protein